MTAIRSALASNLDANLLLASLPLFESEQVQGLEWSFDALYHHQQLPDWFAELIQSFSNEGRLIGHGVYFSLFSGRWRPEQQQWLDQLRRLTREYQFDHLTEHFGFLTGSDFHQGAPLGVPFTASTLALGRDRLKRIQEAARCPVGLENLAFAYSLEEVKRHGDFLDQLLESVNGFIILDLHNLFCQLRNFDLPFPELLASYPLHRVREMHLSGGSWNPSPIEPAKRIRRDTHDEAVPTDVFELLEQAMPVCPHLKYVVLEQIGGSLQTEASRRLFQQDFWTMHELVTARNQLVGRVPTGSFRPPLPHHLAPLPLEDLSLHAQQVLLSEILETATDYGHARTLLESSALARTDWDIENWDPDMIETARLIAQKWQAGFVPASTTHQP